MIAESFRKKMREHAYRKGREEGREEGRREGRRRALDRLVREGYITEEQRNQIEADPRYN